MSDGQYKIVPIRYEDRFDIMKWRNEQMYHLRQSKPLTEEDQERREQILEFMTQFKVGLSQRQQTDARQFLQPLLEDGFVELSGNEMHLTDAGRPFLRNATMFFDERLRRQEPQTQIFSQAL